MGASKEAVTLISPVCKDSMETKLTETDGEKVEEQRGKESHIDASLQAKDDSSSANQNVRENLEEKQILVKSTDIIESPASQNPEAGNSDDGGSEKKVEEQVCPDATGRQMSSNGASVHVSTEGDIQCDISSCISSNEISPTMTDATPSPPASNSLTQTTDPENCPSVETVPIHPDFHKDNSQTSQEEQHNRNTLNGNQHADDMNNHQNESPACSRAETIPTASIQSVPAADKLINSFKSDAAAANVQTEEKEKTRGSSQSIKLPPSQSVSSSNTIATTSPSTSSSLPTGTLVDPKSSLVSLEERLATCGLPEAVDDADFDNKLKVFTNYRNFGAMYQSKNNFKKAEWAFKNGIKQAVGCETRGARSSCEL